MSRLCSVNAEASLKAGFSSSKTQTKTKSRKYIATRTQTIARTPDGILWAYDGNEWRVLAHLNASAGVEAV